MRQLADWNESDLQKLVDDQVQESLTLDYKRLAALHDRKELSKDVSAFANSAGGRLIYGIQESNQRPTRVDDDQSTKALTRETIENVLTSTIHPRVDGLLIKPIPLASGASAFVIDVPAASVFAPHQAQDHRYYRRFNFKSVPMEDYEVRDALRRSQTPHLAVYAYWKKGEQRGEDERGLLAFSIENLGDEPALYTALQIYIDQRLTDAAKFTQAGFEVSSGMTSNGATQVWVGDRKLLAPSHIPLFKGRAWNVCKLLIPVPPTDDYFIGYHVTCPGFEGMAMASINFDGWNIEPRNADGNRLLAKTLGIKRWEA